ncbi:MAG: carboxypeptidase regulatory-like domain-containing protein [Planctomycetota bacterium]
MKLLIRRSGALILFPALLCAVARADFLDGRCVNSQGQGVAGVNIDAKDQNGNDVTLINDGTDANGFFHVTIPAGTFDLTFNPPQPPASASLITELGPVTVGGTTNIGTVQLSPGVALSGRLINPSSGGVPGVNIDIYDFAANESVDLLYDFTDANGNFSFASPSGTVELRFDPAPSGQVLAPKAILLTLTGGMNLGTIQLAQGFVVGAIVRGPGGVPIQNADVDVEVSATGEDLYTPGDNTNASGFVDLVVPAGTYDFEFCPPSNLGLAAGLVSAVAISSNASLGIVNLQSGFVLSGHVQSHTGAPVAGATVRVRNASTGAPIPNCSDHTDGAGNYSTFVPPGTFEVCFLPPNGAPLGSACASSVTVSGPTTSNGTLPPAHSLFCFGDGSLPTACPCGNFGATGRGCANSIAGSTGARLLVSGTTYPDTAAVSASDMRQTALCIFLQGNLEIASGIVFGDGLRCAGGTLKRLATKTAVGGASSYPQVSELPIRQRSSQLGDVIPTGAMRFYLVYYRDGTPGFCPIPPGNTFNATNGAKLAW